MAFYNFDPAPEPELPPVKAQPGRDLKQNTDEWYKSRCGFITASRITDMLAKGNGETRKKYLYELAIERLTGNPRPQEFKSKRMEQGNILEPEGKALYEIYYNEIIDVGSIPHPTIPLFSASPDGLVGNDGGLELKNRDLRIHLDLYFSKKVPRSAYFQMQSQMSCCGLNWVDYGSYNLEQLPSHLQIIVVRVDRNQDVVNEIEGEVIKFNNEINEMCEKLKKC